MTSSVTPRLAATILLLRDRQDAMEVFMVLRHHQIEFVSGALVFPGGSVDRDDSVDAVHSRTDRMDNLDAAAVTVRVAAIREAFEESGFLLARRAGSKAFVTAANQQELQMRYRAALLAGEISFLQILDRENLTLATDTLVPFAHWITPEGMPKRFDTHFFLADVPTDHVGSHDGQENVDSLWIRPSDAVEHALSGRYTIVTPTRLNLEKLARSATSAKALATARAEPQFIVVPKLSTVSESDPRRCIRIPLEVGYGGEVFEI
jgi:8-oxo-dGTP pyrophosphatase MutT (NUDIX family)